MKFVNKLSSLDLTERMWVSAGITIMLTLPLTLVIIYLIAEYGVALFILMPFFMGFLSSILYGYQRVLTHKEACKVSFLTLGIFTVALILFAIEGLICIVMSAPIGLLLTWLGAVSAYLYLKKSSSHSISSTLLILISIPTTALVEKNFVPPLEPVVTTVVIDASPEVVWKYVTEFPELDEPQELLFKAGISYPIDAKIKGKGVGAVRHCNFNTGRFVEPITIWNEPHLLQFDVVEQPQPMKELSFWDIDSPHLHDYFVSKQGQFKLTRLPDGRTELSGTTWYYHNIKPDIYWRIWSDYIIHNIHNRVLNHIKKIAEEERKILNHPK